MILEILILMSKGSSNYIGVCLIPMIDEIATSG